MRTINKGIWYSLAGSALFASGVPLSKFLLKTADPVLFAGLCYFASGAGLSVFSLTQDRNSQEAPLAKKDWPWLAGSILCGGIIAPVLLMKGLALSPNASRAAILFTSEIIFTALLAWAVFKEHISTRVWLAALLVAAGAAALSGDSGIPHGFNKGLLLVVAACFVWGFDNNFTTRLSGKNPATVGIWKGLCAGTFNMALALHGGAHWPSLPVLLGAGITGFVAYGLSLLMFIKGMRELGAARSAAIFGTNPFVSSLLSIIFLHEPLSWGFAAAFGLNGAAAAALFTERHEHEHVHGLIAHNHLHTHEEHHKHEHPAGTDTTKPHSHQHIHGHLVHTHDHMPDEHHRHSH